jgi:replicative DNA helicase
MNARDATIHRVPELFSIEAEQSLIGAVLSDNAAYWRVSEKITNDDFYDPLHGRIWAKIGDLIAKDVRANAVTLTATMASDKGLLEIGADYVRNLISATPTLAPLQDDVRTITDLARRRRIVEASTDAIDRAYYDREAQPEAIADQLGEFVYSAAHKHEIGQGPEPLIDVVRRAADGAERARLNPERARISTGLPCVDDALGGLFPRELHVLGAASSMGKSGLLAQFALSAAFAGYVVLAFSIEMASEELATRYLAIDAKVSANRITEGKTTAHDIEHMAEATLRYTDLPFDLDGSSRLSMAQIRARAQGVRRRRGRIDLIVIDHMRLVRPADPRAPQHEQLDQVTQDAKALAKDLDAAALLVSPMNRELWKRQSHRPIMSDLYGASAIEYNADHIWLLHREEYFLQRESISESDQKSHTEWLTKLEVQRNKAELIGAKRRGGPLSSAMLKFDAPFVRFIDPNHDQPDAQGMIL